MLALLAAGPAAADGPSRFAPVEIKVFRSGQAFVLFEGRVVPEGGLRVPLDFVRKGEWQNLRVWALDGSPLKMLTLQPRNKGRQAAQERKALDEAVSGDPDWVPAPVVEADHTAVLTEPVQRVHLKASILTSRFSWKPQYRLSLEGDGILALDLEASITNNLGDLDSVPVHFLAADLCPPNPWGGYGDPGTLNGMEPPPEDAANPPVTQGCGCQFAPNPYPAVPYYGVVTFPQAFLLGDPAPEGAAAPAPAATPEAPAANAAAESDDELADLPPLATTPSGPFGEAPRWS
jgi:hypothetical protein